MPLTDHLARLERQGKESDKPGYSSSCLHKFLKRMQINHYAFNADGKNFLVCTDFDSHNFSPIIWLVHNGHCYFCTSKEAVKSVAETAKQKAAPRRIAEQTKLPDPESLRFFQGEIEETISGGLDHWEPGIYLCNQPDLQEAYELYVSVTRNEGLRPIQIDANERVSEFSVKTKKGKITFVANPDEGITDQPDLKRAADNAGLTFRGQSLAKLINDILNAPHSRGCLTEDQKAEIVKNQKGKCNCCGEKLGKKIEFDHRKALANGGTNAVENFQALCPSCHQDKTSHELHAGYTFRSPGMCNTMSKTKRAVKFSLSPDEAGTWLAREDFSFVKKLELPCGTGLYMGTFVSEFTSDTTCRPIYQMIVQMEAIEVENLRASVQQWAPPYALKTDAVQFEEPGVVEVWEMQDYVRHQYWDEERTIHKYRYVASDTVKPLSRPSMAGFVRE